MFNFFEDLKNKAKSTPWIKVLQEGKLTESDILDKIDEIFNERNLPEVMLEMLAKSDTKIGINLFSTILEKYRNNGWSVSFDRILKVVKHQDFIKWVNSLNSESTHYYKFMLLAYLNNTMSSTSEIINKLSSTGCKITMQDVMELMNHNNSRHDLHITKFVKDWLATELQPEMVNVVIRAHQQKLISAKEFLNLTVNSTNIINILYQLPELVKEINADSALLNKLFNNIVHNKNIVLKHSDLPMLKIVITDEGVLNLVIKEKMSNLDKICSYETLDWNYYDSCIDDLSTEERYALFYRKDIPVWFLTKYQAVVLHMSMLQDSQMKEFVIKRHRY